jgi:hypothetical protein
VLPRTSWEVSTIGIFTFLLRIFFVVCVSIEGGDAKKRLSKSGYGFLPPGPACVNEKFLGTPEIQEMLEKIDEPESVILTNDIWRV